MPRSQGPLESRESSSPLITRAAAAVLGDREFEAFQFPNWQKAGLYLLCALPPSLIRRLVQWQSKQTLLDPALAKTLRTEQLVTERLGDYQDLEGQWGHVLVGAGLGGAAAHLAAVLGAPFLPQPFVLSFRGGSRDDEVLSHARQGRELAEAVLRNNPDLLAISHFDPIHDGWLTRFTNHLRLKLTDVPQGYRQFILNRLRPGGTLVYLDCGAEWLQYSWGPRHVLQIGGWGDIPAQEFLNGSERIDRFLAANGSRHRGGWALGDHEPQLRPESEWGTEPGLGEQLERLCQECGYRFVRLSLPHPHDFSLLAFKAYQELCRRCGVSPQGVVVETFTQYDPQAPLKASLLPLWLIFNTRDSLQFLSSCTALFPADKPLFFSALVSFTRTPDMVPWFGWDQALRGRRWTNIGAQSFRYPGDPLALWLGPLRLRRWVESHPAPLEARLSVDDLLALMPRM